MSLNLKEVRPILTIYDQFVENATGLWVMSTRSTSSRLYRGARITSISGSVSSTQVPHLLLRLRLEEHENKDHQGKTA
jgi:hypothetical protein